MGPSGRSIQLDKHFLYTNFSCAGFTLLIIQDILQDIMPILN